jgi:DNA-binding LacI/PurR family transcriptional regulator
VTGEPSHANPSPGQPLTIAQIAELTGVSVPTVSKVVNGHSEVAAEARAMAENAIQEHGYRRRKRAGPAPLLELVFHELEGPYALEFINGVDEGAPPASPVHDPRATAGRRGTTRRR